MSRFHVKTGDEVVVISGAEKGKRGKVLRIQAKNERVIVEGLQMIKRHMRKTQTNPKGEIIEREGTMHISNLMKAEVFDARASKRGTAAPQQS
jgi:large subunit ribosomal protein L24